MFLPALIVWSAWVPLQRPAFSGASYDIPGRYQARATRAAQGERGCRPSGAGHLAGAALAAILVAGGFAFMHSTLQTWATVVSFVALAALSAIPLGLVGSAARLSYDRVSR